MGRVYEDLKNHKYGDHCITGTCEGGGPAAEPSPQGVTSDVQGFKRGPDGPLQKSTPQDRGDQLKTRKGPESI